MIDILSVLPSKRRRTPKGWWSFNCPVCHLHGHSRDKRSRGGMHIEPDGAWSYSCFNCNHKARFVPGEVLSRKARQLLIALGLSEDDITSINLESVRIRGLLNYIEKPKFEFKRPTFQPLAELPGELLDPSNPAHQEHYEYVRQRRIDHTRFPFLVDLKAERPGIIIPFTIGGMVVGYTTRYFDNRKPKYLSVQPEGYIFGLDWQQPDWTVALVVEGPFDAMSINGLATMHQVMSPEQLMFIKSLGKEVIVVPDQNVSGMEIVDQAINEGFSVSIPEWHPGITDVNEATKAYGRLGALLTILRNKESNPIKIELRRKALAQRLLA